MFLHNRKEITYDEFLALIKDVAPKYQAQQKLKTPEEAEAQLKKKLLGGTDATAGTTVRTGILHNSSFTVTVLGDHLPFMVNVQNQLTV